MNGRTKLSIWRVIAEMKLDFRIIVSLILSTSVVQAFYIPGKCSLAFDQKSTSKQENFTDMRVSKAGPSSHMLTARQYHFKSTRSTLTTATFSMHTTISPLSVLLQVRSMQGHGVGAECPLTWERYFEATGS